MKKYMILYKIKKDGKEMMMNKDMNMTKEGWDEWSKWSDMAKKEAKSFDFGMPLMPVSKITDEGVMESDSMISGYSMIEGDKMAIENILKKHPHLKTPGACILLLEILPMPGM